MSEPASFAAHRKSAPWLVRSAWPFSWVSGTGRAPCVEAYRLRFTTAATQTMRLVVTADERYRLYLDGKLLRSGPETGSRWHWVADLVEVEVPAGEHLLMAVVWSVGEADGDYATDGIRHGFALGVDGEANGMLATGKAAWEWRELPGYSFKKVPMAFWTVPDLFREAGATDWEAEVGSGEGWSAVKVVSPVHHVGDVEVFPARLVKMGTLPKMMHARWTKGVVRHAERVDVGADLGEVALGENDAGLAKEFEKLFSGEGKLTVPPRTVVRGVIDFQTYLTAWPEFSAGGAGAVVRVEWMEALSKVPLTKGQRMVKENRNEIAGRYVWGLGDEVRCDGKMREWRPLYWRAGRYLIVTVRSGEEPAVVSGLKLFEDRYPLEQEGRLEVAHEGLTSVKGICLRSLQVNAHDIFSDTPYYERMQYIGDTRLDCLNTYVLMRDDRLAVKALRLADAQRMPNGLTVSRPPTRNLQVIPPFSLMYVGMLHDHLWWRGDLQLVRRLMPGVRGVLDAFLRHRVADGTVGFIEGWNTCDWSPPFKMGEAAGVRSGNVLSNLWFLLGMMWAEEMERELGEMELAARWKRLRGEVARGIVAAFWDEGKGRWADDREHTSFSQHGQALAALCPDFEEVKRRRAMIGLATDKSLAPASLYFMHYLFEAWAAQGDGQAIVDSFKFWSELRGQGFVATPETPGDSRSDSHAWSAHPLFHIAATLAGIRPAAAGFKRVRVAPCMGNIPRVSVRIPHPGGGWISAELENAGGRLTGRIELPEGLGGELVWGGKRTELKSEENSVAMG